ncbi:arsenic efflux protein [Gemmiger formicilis]|uniref:arsenic efflux protein n=1 Tax=Gemmiger formicilis TaxID=745368 RepID=UPI00195E7AC8|nr:putative manganese transporter [Gemmiger formicilis]MBM6716039.1 arsenic efflux protein [Gemmiger formicilis]
MEHIILHTIEHALEDSLKMLPFLFLAYLLIEWLERHHGERIENALAGGGRWGFVPGAVLGIVPQCGFSALAANLYASRVITPGALLAVFVATSDEAVPLLAAEPSLWGTLPLLLIGKVVAGVAGGFLLDVPLRRVLPARLYGGYAGHADDIDCHEEHEEHSGVLLAALRHTVEIFLFILLFSFLIGFAFELIGEDTITAFLTGMGIFQPMAAALVGLVPNCAASVLLAQLYAQGAISFGSLFAGLCAGAGIGLAVLWRVNPSWKQNLFMTGILWAGGSVCGIVLQFLPL